MQMAKLFKNGSSQAVRLPKEFRFKGDEVCIARMGEMVVLYPKDKADHIFYSSLGKFDDDFYEAIYAAREEDKNRFEEREPL
ncbi:MAG: type II toxin-antitoxin system VapB family antitoxin [Clostridia bacterium]|nr:type II toxin-antitoxin system VapB family antitoxin [Clostridia bacterium]